MASHKTCKLFVVLFVISLYCCTLVQSDIIGIDLGSDYLKVGKVQSNRGVQVVHNEQSKRKTPSVLAFPPDGSFLFGDLAVASNSKFPNRTALHPLEYLTGYEEHRSLLEEQGFSHSAQIYALFLKQALKIANASQHSVVAGLVIPPWLNLQQRQNVLFACEMVDISSVVLIHSNTACAVKYLLDWKPEQPQLVLFIDIGVESTIATIVSVAYQSTGTSVTPQSYHLQVKSHSWDKTLGGKYIDERLANWIVQKAATKGQLGAHSPSFIMNHAKCQTRVLQEAKRIKEILTVNQETVASLENIIDSIDIQVPIYRREVEALLIDSHSISRLVNHSLTLANLQKEQIDVIVPFGGTSRIPLIQHLLKQSLKELNKSIHADEGAVYGATFYAALSSPKIRSRALSIKEWQTFDIWIQIFDSNETCLWDAPLVQIGESIPTTKEFIFHPKNDFDIHLYAFRNESMVYLLENTQLYPNESSRQWLGNTTFHVNFMDSCDYSNSYVRMEIGMNIQGFISPPELEWICTENNNLTDTVNNTSNTMATGVQKERRRQLLEVKNIQSNYGLLLPFWNHSTLEQLKVELQQRQQRDAEVRRHSDMCNELESRILLYRQRLTEQGHEWNVFTCEKERQKILHNLEQLESWLYSYPQMSLIQQKQQQMQDWILPIQERIEMNRKIQKAVEQLNSTLIFAKQVLEAGNISMSPELSSSLDSEVNELEKWLNNKWNEYIQKAPYEESRTKNHRTL
ncbi:heat shock protein Hsp70 isoform 1 [Galdieria sulphuraria]|uniref:Heat shock protein Hsp70 isoform 1 n=1 Tax=Galdieria sulphuraria TaxID=130081 RepID=M2VYJ4_GALSU|nr:heat shock protein Hsp70 isoform 1 [Galdieria sulphuraria]EME28351.1 heat shock protein Hsp70 isoform 1 [Galdieria sulphuraria]|eukprot:XP_005704871.1 heat shock protein Hsp70 isoform 1 [Galdieria sulphuraria]